MNIEDGASRMRASGGRKESEMLTLSEHGAG